MAMVDMGSATLLEEARDYFRVLEAEEAMSAPRDHRLQEIEAEIASRGTYRQSIEELTYGAKLAWRNSVRCVGRKYWHSLAVRDCRHLETAEEVFEALVEHLRRSTNGGWIAPLISVFAQEEHGRPGIRIWNEQLIRYAGYRQPDGSILGDPSQARFTDLVCSLGWRGAGTAWRRSREVGWLRLWWPGLWWKRPLYVPVRQPCGPELPPGQTHWSRSAATAGQGKFFT